MSTIINFPNGIRVQGGEHKLADLIEEYLLELQRRGYSKHTIRAYSIALKRLLIEQGPGNIYEITTPFLAQILNDPNWDKKTLAARQAAIKSFFRWAFTQNYINLNPAEALGGIKTTESLPRPIPQADLIPILGAARKIPLAPRTLFYLLGDLALRVDEGLGLDVNDITWNKGQEAVIVEHGKGNRERVIPFTWNMACTPLLKRLCNQQKTGALFTTNRETRGDYDWAYYWWEKTLKIANAQHYTIHQLRHTAITEMIRDGMNLMAVKRLAGHKRIQSTEIYTQVTGEDIRKEYEKSGR